ncbi:lipopolysaccharide biosynthesis protein [Azotobacter beijerinckii]|uniref:Membrane protein involved in the export of O-antigen and teichoic acid n=1 Tax=Azotobacter beijerinckii TaxID=170623 RepID=A0A1I4AAQ2_9GAMM|nr:oligosaccharide flippase family protein [Azotobacter beijerinckii]SFA92497.1 Membrane protein involved in the export of O-antigen and teichoic acid [Azotobacter beijerinckii]SFK53478.1 Membrane protein involved in the export of O-antigen and teichoic acid [Azotobacter beijerinckii]
MKSNDYVRQLILSIGTKLAMLALRLLRNVLLARILGPADRGLFALLGALPELIGAITSGGLNTAVGYQAARQHPMGLLLTLMLIYGCLASALATLFGVEMMQLFGQDLAIMHQLGPFAWLLLLAVPLFVLKSALLTLHNADGRVGTFNGLRLLESLVPLLLFLALFWMWPHAALSAALISWLGGLALVAAVGLCLLARYHNIRLRWDSGSQGELLRFGSRSHPDVLFQQLLMRADYLLIGLLLDSEKLGYYAMATAAAELLSIVPEAVTTPLMKRLLQQGEGIDQLTPLALRLTGTAMLAACLSLALVGEWLIVTLFGSAFQPAYPALLALLPGMFSLCYTSILHLDLLGKERPGTLSVFAGGAAALDLLLAVLLIPRWGIVGAAIASSVAHTALALAMLLLYGRVSGIAIGQTLLILPSDLRLLRAQLRPAT